MCLCYNDSAENRARNRRTQYCCLPKINQFYIFEKEMKKNKKQFFNFR
jgi:hypothetical protein